MKSVKITGYLPSGVTDNKHRSAREASGFLKTLIKKGNGKLKKIEVLMGIIFITLEDQNGVAELKSLSNIQGVTVDEPDDAMLLFAKTRARGEAERVAQKITP